MTLNWTVFFFGLIGGALAEVLKWWQLREAPTPPAYLKSGFYWIITVIMALVAGILAIAYGIDANKPVLAINVGVSAPLILKGLASVVPTKPAAGASFAGTPRKASVLDMIAAAGAGAAQLNYLTSRQPGLRCLLITNFIQKE
jgi:hypothetical protein